MTDVETESELNLTYTVEKDEPLNLALSEDKDAVVSSTCGDASDDVAVNSPIPPSISTKRSVRPEEWISIAEQCQYLPEEDVISLCSVLISRLSMQPNIISVSSPVVICGDIHGQFYDLMELFKISGGLRKEKYIFMGDYVDRGHYSLETCTLLFAYLLQYPDRITLLRGNHESRKISSAYGFYDECINKYGNPVAYKWFCKVFDVLPISAVVDDNIICVHGGLSPEIKTLDKMCSLDRAGEVPNKGALCDIMWSDPEEDQEGWMMSQRGAGWLYGRSVVKEFLETNNLSLICRSHQLVDEGYRYMFDNRLITVWSAPNYCYRCGNVASVLKIEADGKRGTPIFHAVAEDQRKRPERNPAPYFL